MTASSHPSEVAPPGPKWSRTRDFAARMSEIQDANSFLVRAFDGYPGLKLTQPTLFDLRLAVTETFANIVEHSYGNEPGNRIHMTVRVADCAIEVLFEDSGRRPDPRRLRSRSLDEYRERGLGLFLMSRCMDEVEFRFRRDGTNLLRICRRIDEETTVRRSSNHQPFHIAIFERLEAITVRPIGSLDRTRPDPFARLLKDDVQSLTLDLADLDELDSWAVGRLAAFAARARETGRRLDVGRPSPVIEKLLETTGVLEVIAPEGWMKDDAVYADETPMRLREAGRIGRFMPLFRTADSTPTSGSIDDDARAWLAPRSMRVGAIEIECTIPAVPGGPVWIVRPVALDSVDVVFLVSVRSDIAGTLMGAALVRTALGTLPDFRGRLCNLTVTEFVQRLSAGLRDLLPGAWLETEADPPILLVAFEFQENAIRVLSGFGPVVAVAESRSIRAVFMGGSEHAGIETHSFDRAASALTMAAPGFRIHFGAIEGGDGSEGRDGRPEKAILDVRRVAP